MAWWAAGGTSSCRSTVQASASSIVAFCATCANAPRASRGGQSDLLRHGPRVGGRIAGPLHGQRRFDAVQRPRRAGHQPKALGIVQAQAGVAYHGHKAGLCAGSRLVPLHLTRRPLGRCRRAHHPAIQQAGAPHIGGVQRLAGNDLAALHLWHRLAHPARGRAERAQRRHRNVLRPQQAFACAARQRHAQAGAGLGQWHGIVLDRIAAHRAFHTGQPLGVHELHIDCIPVGAQLLAGDLLERGGNVLVIVALSRQQDNLGTEDEPSRRPPTTSPLCKLLTFGLRNLDQRGDAHGVVLLQRSP